MPILSKETCQDQRIPSYSASPYSLQNYAQTSNTPLKGVSPIKDTHESIDGLGQIAHSKDANIPIHYPFTSPKSILGPYLSKLKPSNLPSILGPYVPPYPTFTPISSPSSPMIPQDQQRHHP